MSIEPLKQKKKGTAIFWARNDLRILANDALLKASQFEYMIPVFTGDYLNDGMQLTGEAGKWWLHHSIHGCLFLF